MKSKNLITVSYNGLSLNLIFGETNIVFPISCSKNGRGEKNGSYKTPRGMFEIYKKIGNNAKLGTVFKSRKNTGEIWREDGNFSENAILTRILWLTGLEKHNENTKERFVYIHGTNREDDIGKVHFSHGCVLMKNEDIVRLFDLVKAGDYVFIY